MRRSSPMSRSCAGAARRTASRRGQNASARRGWWPGAVMPLNKQALAVLNQVFGYPEFRGHQAAVIEHVASGGDALVLMPTGSGKSLCYQIPALLREGMGVVVSPLISLMQDQVAALAELGVRAAFLNSTLSGA